MIYISPENEYPRHVGDIQLQYPEYQIGEQPPTGWIEVTQVEPPVFGEYEVLYEDFPIEVDGVMTQNWQIRDMTDEEIERRDAPETAKQKLLSLGLTSIEIEALINGMVR